MDLAAVLADPARARALVLWNINIAASTPASATCAPRSRATTSSCVASTSFATDTDGARRRGPARGELPRARRPRRAVLRPRTVGAGEAVDPPGEALPNRRSSAGWRARWASTIPSCTSRTDAVIDGCSRGSGARRDLRRAAPRAAPSRPGRAAVRSSPTACSDAERADRARSGAAEADGHPRVPLPDADPPPAAGCLRLLSPASPWTMNGRSRNDRRSRRRLGAATVTCIPTRPRRAACAAGGRAR